MSRVLQVASKGRHALPVAKDEPSDGDFIVTPDVAFQWLTRNTINRTVTKAHVERLAIEMATDRWMLNGEAVKFASTGKLLDGQHRLTACIEAMKPFPTKVVTGLEEAVFKTLDQGKVRTAADLLTIDGQKFGATNTAAATMLVWQYQLGKIIANAQPPRTVIRDMAVENPGIAKACDDAKAFAKVMPVGVGGFLLFMFAQKDVVLASEFRDAMAIGANMAPDDPFLRLRNAWLENRAATRKRGRPEMIAISIKAWNAKREDPDKGVRVLRHATGERFPKIL